MMHQGRRQNQGDYYPHHGYYQQPQPQYHNRHAGQYVQPQWYPPPYPIPGAYPPHYHTMPPQPQPQPQPPLQRGPLIVSSHPQPLPQVHDQQNPPVHRQSMPSSSIATPIQAAPSTPSVQSQPLESPATPTTSISASAYTPPPTSDPQPIAPVSTPSAATRRMPFYPELPWYSVPESPFPSRAPRRKRKARQATPTDSSLELPAKPDTEVGAFDTEHTTEEKAESQLSAVAGRAGLETPATPQAPSEVESTHAHALSSFSPSSDSNPTVSPTTTRISVRPVVPIVPVVKTPPSSQQLPPTTATEHQELPAGTPREITSSQVSQQAVVSSADSTRGSLSPPAIKPAPKSWADLVRSKLPAPASVQQPKSNGAAPEKAFGVSNAGSLAEVIRSFSVNSGAKLVFLKPRGLVNTGNMCYMNSVSLSNSFPNSLMLTRSRRFFKFWCFVCPVMISSTKSGNVLLTVSRARPPFWTRCE
jgi:ubiquitin carboxyl-terminal hydrolase 10